jgi:hypothetical protein
MNSRKKSLQAQGTRQQQPSQNLNARPAHQQGLLQRKALASQGVRQSPLPPPVYHPQPVPKVLQLKAAVVSQPSPGGHLRSSLAASPVRHPRQAVSTLQRNEAANPKPPSVRPVINPPPPPPPVYRPHSTPKVLQRRTVNSPSHPAMPNSIIQRANKKGVSYTNIGLTYSQQEIEDAGGGTSAHGTGKRGSHMNDNTKRENAELVERLQANRAHKKQEKKNEIASALAEKHSGKRPTKSKLRAQAVTIANEHASDIGEGMEVFKRYLLSQGFSDGEADELVEELYPI